MMQRIAATTDHTLLSSLAANREALARGRLVALPLADPAVRASFAIVRLESRTLPPIADILIREVVAADRASFVAERALEPRAPGGSIGRTTRRPRATAAAGR